MRLSHSRLPKPSNNSSHARCYYGSARSENLFPHQAAVFWARTVGHVKAVDGVSLDIYPGKTLGLVGESGCGKTTVGRTILRLIPKATGGTVAL